MYGPINDDGMWTARHNDELYALYDELYIVKVMKLMRLGR